MLQEICLHPLRGPNSLYVWQYLTQKQNRMQRYYGSTKKGCMSGQEFFYYVLYIYWPGGCFSLCRNKKKLLNAVVWILNWYWEMILSHYNVSSKDLNFKIQMLAGNSLIQFLNARHSIFTSVLYLFQCCTFRTRDFVLLHASFLRRRRGAFFHFQKKSVQHERKNYETYQIRIGIDYNLIFGIGFWSSWKFPNCNCIFS